MIDLPDIAIHVSRPGGWHAVENIFKITRHLYELGVQCYIGQSFTSPPFFPSSACLAPLPSFSFTHASCLLPSQYLHFSSFPLSRTFPPSNLPPSLPFSPSSPVPPSPPASAHKQLTIILIQGIIERSQPSVRSIACELSLTTEFMIRSDGSKSRSLSHFALRGL